MKTLFFLLLIPNFLLAQSFEGEIKYRFKMETENENLKKNFLNNIQPEHFDLLFKENKMREITTSPYYYLENNLQDYSVHPDKKKIMQTDWNGEKQTEKKLIKTQKDSVILNKKCTLYQDTENKENQYWITDEIQPNVKGCKGLVHQGKAILYQKVVTPLATMEIQAEEINIKKIENSFFDLPANFKIEKMKPVKINNIYPTF